MKRLFLIFPVLLTGCNQWKQITGTHDTLLQTAASKTVLIMGQSNAVRLSPSGNKGWNDARKTQDTFINCAVNGSSISQWVPGGPYEQNCIAMTQGKHIDVILWYQGESDSDPTGHYADYAYQLTTLFTAWRGYYGNVPILYAQIATADYVRWNLSQADWNEVKSQQASIFYPNTGMIRTDDITVGTPLSNDGIHFSDAGDYELGARFAKAYMTVGG